MLKQRTIREKASCTGVGLHSGKAIRLEVLPAPEDSGITFVRLDAPSVELKATVEHVVDTTLATTLGSGVNGSRITIATVEHLLAALSGLGIDNARVLVDGPEVPVLDGSAGPFVDMLRRAGLEEQKKNKRFLVIKKEVRIQQGDKLARVQPGQGLRISCQVDFDHPLISPTPYRFDYSEKLFCRDIARARTFGFLRDVEALRARGLARGGSLDNAIVIDHYRVLNPEGLRYADEFVRHKVLDAVGDIALFGMALVGRVTLHRSGHALHTQLVRKILADPKAYEIVQPADAEAARATFGVASPLSVFEPAETLA